MQKLIVGILFFPMMFRLTAICANEAEAANENSIIKWMVSDLSYRNSVEMPSDVSSMLQANMNLFHHYHAAVGTNDVHIEENSDKDGKSSEQNGVADTIVLNFENVTMHSVLLFLSEIIGLNFIYPEGLLDFTVSLVAPNKVPVRDLEAIILKLLEMHGIHVDELGGSLYLSKIGGPFRIGELDDQGHFYITKVFRVYKVSADDISSLIMPLMSAKSNIGVVGSNVIVTDTVAMIDRVSALIGALETEDTDLHIREVIVSHADVKSVAELVIKIMAPFIVGQAFVLVPYEKHHKLFIVASTQLLNKCEEIVQSLDAPTIFRSSDNSVDSLRDMPRAYVHRIKYQNANSVLSILKQWGSVLTADDSATMGLQSVLQRAHIIGDSNLVTYYAKPYYARLISSILDTLDFPFGVVSVEMVILETSASRQYSFGVDWAGNTKNPETKDPSDYVVGVGSNNMGALGSLIKGITNLGVNIGKGFSWSAIGNVLTFQGFSFDNIGAFVNAVNQDSESHIVWCPTITASDMKNSELFFGQQVPVRMGSTTTSDNSTTFSNVSVIDIGAKLKVRASIGASDEFDDSDILMDIYQEISEIATDSSGGVAGYPVTYKYVINTSVRVPNDTFLMLSGMTREAASFASSGMPCGNIFCNALRTLSKILGGSLSQSSSKKCLMVFVRPHIIKGIEDLDKINREKIEVWNDEDISVPIIHKKLDEMYPTLCGGKIETID